MKILYKNMGFGGGAPRSLLEFIKIALKNNIEVLAVGQYTYMPINYLKYNIRLIELPYFELKKPLRSFWILLKYLKIITTEKPDIIHAITQENCVFHKIISKVTKVPVIYNIPGGQITWFAAGILLGEKLLVFSEENKKQLIKYGHKKNDICVISNRMNINNTNNEYKKHYSFTKNRKTNQIRFLMISRMSSDKVNSIKHVIKTVRKLNEENVNVTLDILGDGENYSSILELANEVNHSLKKNVIILHGFKHNVKPYILRSHVVFGKGRSVIEGILNCRISFVVSENHTFSLCNLKTFDNLKTYNFSGRSLKYIVNYEYLVEFLNDLYNNNVDINYLKELKDVTSYYYDIKYAEEKIMQIYKNATTKDINFNYNILHIIKEYILLYLKIFKLKISRTSSNER